MFPSISSSHYDLGNVERDNILFEFSAFCFHYFIVFKNICEKWIRNIDPLHNISQEIIYSEVRHCVFAFVKFASCWISRLGRIIWYDSKITVLPFVSFSTANWFNLCNEYEFCTSFQIASAFCFYRQKYGSPSHMLFTYAWQPLICSWCPGYRSVVGTGYRKRLGNWRPSRGKRSLNWLTSVLQRYNASVNFSIRVKMSQITRNTFDQTIMMMSYERHVVSNRRSFD